MPGQNICFLLPFLILEKLLLCSTVDSLLTLKAQHVQVFAQFSFYQVRVIVEFLGCVGQHTDGKSRYFCLLIAGLPLLLLICKRL